MSLLEQLIAAKNNTKATHIFRWHQLFSHIKSYFYEVKLQKPRTTPSGRKNNSWTQFGATTQFVYYFQLYYNGINFQDVNLPGIKKLQSYHAKQDGNPLTQIPSCRFLYCHTSPILEFQKILQRTVRSKIIFHFRKFSPKHPTSPNLTQLQLTKPNFTQLHQTLHILTSTTMCPSPSIPSMSVPGMLQVYPLRYADGEEVLYLSIYL